MKSCRTDDYLNVRIPMWWALSLILLAACGSDSTGPDPTDVGEPGSVTGVIGPAGGTLSVTTAQAIEVTLTIPAGALVADQQITLDPGVPVDGDWLAVELVPEGLILLEPAVIEVSLPDGLVAEEHNLHWGTATEPIYLPTTSGTGNTSVLTEVRTFGLAHEVRVMPGSALDTAAPTEAITVARRAAGSNNLGASPTTCAQLLAAAKADFDRLKTQEDYKGAVNAALNGSALMIRGGCPDAEDFGIEAVEYACEHLGDLFTEGLGTPVTDWGEFEAQVRPVIEWHGFLQVLGNTFAGPCGALDRTGDFVLAKIDDFLVFYDTVLAQLDSANLASFVELKQELAHIWHMWADAQTLGVQEAQAIYDHGVQKTLDQLREVSWNMAHDDGVYYPLSRLTSTGFLAGRDIIGVPAPRPCDDYFTPPRCPTVRQISWYSDRAIYEDLQFAGTNVMIDAVTASDGVLDSGTAEGVGMGDVANQPELDCPTRGVVRLTGLLQGMTCWDDIEADKEMIVAVNSVDVMTLRRPVGGDNYLADPAELLIADLVSAGVTIPKEGSFAELTVRRKRTECDERLWGPEEFELFTAKLNWKNPTIEAAVQMPASVTPGETVDVSVRVKVIDQLGQAGFFDGIDVVLQGAGGTLEQLSGQTDSQGYFRTRLAVDASAIIVDGVSGVARLGVSVGATATSYEGVSAQSTGTATLAGESRAEAISHTPNVWATASGAEGSDSASDGTELDYPFGDFSGSVDASATGTDPHGDPYSHSASASLVVGPDFAAGAVLNAYNASGQTLTSSSGRGGSHAWSKFTVNVTIVGGPVDYQFTGTLSGPDDFMGASLDKHKREGGWEFPEIFSTNVSGSFSESGTLGIGTYRIRAHCVSDSGAETGASSFVAQFNFGSAPGSR